MHVHGDQTLIVSCCVWRHQGPQLVALAFYQEPAMELLVSVAELAYPSSPRRGRIDNLWQKVTTQKRDFFFNLPLRAVLHPRSCSTCRVIMHRWYLPVMFIAVSFWGERVSWRFYSVTGLRKLIMFKSNVMEEHERVTARGGGSPVSTSLGHIHDSVNLHWCG